MPIYNLGEHSWVQILHPKKMPKPDFVKLWNLPPKKKGRFLMGGNVIETPRRYRNYLRNYRYGGQLNKGYPLPRGMKRLLEWVREWTGEHYNQFSIIWYKNGNDYMGKHRDQTKPLVGGSNILVISLGATRTFRIRDGKTKKIVRDIEVKDGSCIIMGGRMQEEFYHELVKVNGEKGKNLEERISINMRQFKN